MKWINVSEGFPEPRVRVLVTDGELVSIGWINSRLRNKFTGIATIDDEYMDEIIAWAELPKYGDAR